MNVFSSLCKRSAAVAITAALFFQCSAVPAFAATAAQPTQETDTAVSNVNFCGSNAFKTQVQNIVANGKVPSGGTTYYVAENGSDSNAGTEQQPFKTIQKGVKALKAGDNLLIRGGTYNEKVTVSNSGKSTQYISIGNYPSEEVILSGSHLSGKKNQTLLSIKGSYVSVSGITVDNLQGNNACGVSIETGAKAVILQSMTVQNIKCAKPVTRERDSEENCANAILMLGDSADKSINDILVYNCLVTDCDTGFSEAVSITGNATNINIVNNTVRNITNIGIDFSGNYGYCDDPALDFPRSCVATGNFVENCVAQYATSHGIYVDGGQSIIIHNNEVNACGGGIEIGAEETASSDKYETKNIKVSNNTLTNNIDVGIAVGGYDRECGNVSTVRIVGNKCLENGIDKGEILRLSKCSNVLITDNAFISATSDGEATIVSSQMKDTDTQKILIDNNTYHNGGSKDDTSFTWLKKEYISFDSWRKVAGETKGTYSSETTVVGAATVVGSTLYHEILAASVPEKKTFWMISFLQDLIKS